MLFFKKNIIPFFVCICIGLLLSFFSQFVTTSELENYRALIESSEEVFDSFEEIDKSWEAASGSLKSESYRKKQIYFSALLLPLVLVLSSIYFYRVGMAFNESKSKVLVIFLTIMIFIFGYTFQPFFSASSLLSGFFLLHRKIKFHS